MCLKFNHRFFINLLILSFLVSISAGISSCSRNSSYKVKVVKPRTHFGWYDAKKDRRKKRTKIVKYKVH